MQKGKRSYVYMFAFCCLIFLCSFSSLNAATVQASPAKVNLDIGEIANVQIITNTQSANINAIEGTVQFDSSVVEVVSVSKNNSVLDIWIEEPAYSNSSGNISFNGGVVPPGYTGSYGEIFTVAFKAKKAGTSQLRFSGVSIRLNDGAGTDAFSGASQGALTVSAQSLDPSLIVDPEADKKLLKSIKEAPKEVKIDISTMSTSSNHVFEIKAKDSDLHYADVSINGEKARRFYFSQGKALVDILDGVPVGSNFIHIQVYDKAGNVTELKTTIDIPDSSTISLYNSDSLIDANTSYTITGTSSFSNSKIEIYIMGPNDEVVEYEIRSNAQGEFELMTEFTRDGVYEVWAKNPTELKSEKVKVEVRSSVVKKVDMFILEHRTLIRGLFVALLFVLLFTVLYLKRKVHKVRKNLNLRSIEQHTEESLKILKYDAQKQLMYLDSLAQIRELTEEEKRHHANCLEILK